MKKISIFLILLLGTSLLVCASELILVQNGKADTAIVLGKKPTVSAQLGAYELQHFIRCITGATLPIRTEKASEKVKIFIGDSAGVRQAGIRKETLQKESYCVKRKGNDIYLIGNDSAHFAKVDYKKVHTFPKHYFTTNGSLFAVYDFLENQCNVTFCGPWEDSVSHPKSKTLSVNVKDRTYTPPLDAFRNIYDDDRTYSAVPFSLRERALWALRWRLTSIYGAATHNCYSIYFQHWAKAKSPVLAGEFKIQRKDLFAQGYEGTHSPHDPAVRRQYPDDPDLPPQLCFSNPDTMKFFAKEALTYYNGKNVRGGWWNSTGRVSPERTLTPRLKGYPFYYPVESADSNLFCKCAKCKALFPELKGDQKTSHLKFHFISGIAREAAKLNPAAGISTLSYIQTLPYPHKIQLPPNLSVQLCLTHFAWWHPGIRKAQEREYNKWMKMEAKKRPVTLWLYLFTPHWDGRIHYHYNNFPGLYPWEAGKMMKKFAADGVKGFFTEVELQYGLAEAYVTAKLAFDPSLDVNKVVDRWMLASYGKAAPVMKEIYKICQDAYWDHKNYPQEWFRDPDNPQGPRGRHNPYWGTALQSEDVNWTYGLRKFQKIETLLAKAKTLVQRPSEKALLDRFIKGIWETARKGRIEYELKMANMGKQKLPSLTAVPVKDAKGDPRKVDWSKIAPTPEWKYVSSGKVHPKKIRMKVASDQEYMYFAYEEALPPGKTGRGNAFWTNCAELFFSEMPYIPAYHIAVGTHGELRQFLHERKNDVRRMTPCDLSVRFFQEENSSSWRWKMSIPLRKLPLGKFKTGLSANFFRSLPGKKSAAWSPLFVTDAYLQGLARSGRIHLGEIVYEENVFSRPRILKDSAAGNGACAVMNGNRAWSLRCHTGPIEKAQYYVDVLIRTEAKGPEDLTTRVGFYDQIAKRVLTVNPIKVREISSKEYKKITFGPVTLNQNAYFYIGGFNHKNIRPNGVFLDRMVLRKVSK